MIDRRRFLGMTAGAGATLALTPELLRALQGFEQPRGNMIQRAIPSTGEMLPVISFDPAQESDTAGMKELLRALLDGGGKVVDFPHGGGEQVARRAADELGMGEKFFWTTALSAPPAYPGPVLPGAVRKVDPAAVRAAVEAKLAQFKTSSIDLVMVNANSDVPTHVAALRELKKEGKVRYIGVHDLTPPPYPPEATYARLEAIMRSEPIDFVGTDYSAGWRGVESTLLPLAMERKIGFMAHFTLDRGRIFQRVGNTPLPSWAAEFDATTWAQFLLKYVVSHPAVTVARVGTTRTAHMVDNIGGGVGRLPDQAMRARMAAFVDALPARQNPNAPAGGGRTVATSEPMQPSVVLSAAVLDRYAGEYLHVAAGTTLTVRRDGDRLLANVQGSGRPELPLVARSELRFAVSPITSLEFQLDGGGKVTGAVWATEPPAGMAPQRIALERR